MADRETRNFYISIGICPECRKNRLFGDERSCIECKAKKAVYNKTYHSKHAERDKNKCSDYNKKVYRDRIGKGICTRCGKRKAEPMRKKCRLCLDKDARVQRLRRDYVT